WLLNEIGIDYAKSYLSKMNMDIEADDLGIALGALSEGLTPIQLVEGYRTFVHNGEMIDSHAIVEIQKQKGETVASANSETTDGSSPQVAGNITGIFLRTAEGGTGQAGHCAQEDAGKAGTTQQPTVEGESRDACFVGLTPDYVTALWMEYDESDENQYL